MTPKFRAWIKSRQQMMEVVCIAYKYSDVGGLDYIISYVEAASDSSRKFTTSEPYFLDDFVLMQSTGVKDCNGKEIYEGDIVEVTYTKQVWDAIPVYCVNRKAKYDYIIDSLEDFFYTRKRGYIADSELKVLGNIYENPELKEELMHD